MSQRDDERTRRLKQYIVFRVKLIEFTHLFQITTEFSARRVAPENSLDHGWQPYGETLLYTTITHFLSFTDLSKGGLDIKKVWTTVFPRHKRSIERCWQSGIEAGWLIARHYRDNVGAHSGNLDKFLIARGTLMAQRAIVIKSIGNFLELAGRLLLKEEQEIPDFHTFIETVLLDFELKTGRSLNRRWLRKWKLIESQPFRKTY